MKQITEKIIMHHGVKGQKWGVRNGPPYPIEDRVLRKGTKINTVQGGFSDNPINKKAMYGYNPDDEWDSKVYKGPFSVYLKYYKGARFVEEHSYEVVEDLKMPTSKERIDEFISLFEKDEQVMIDLKNVQNVYRELGSSSKAALMDLDKDERNEQYYRNAYELFNHALENVAVYVSGAKYLDLMSQKYDAMVDDNNVNSYNAAHDPIIIFRANKVLKEIGNFKIVTDKEIVENYKFISSELSKLGKKTSL